MFSTWSEAEIYNFLIKSYIFEWASRLNVVVNLTYHCSLTATERLDIGKSTMPSGQTAYIVFRVWVHYRILGGISQMLKSCLVDTTLGSRAHNNLIKRILHRVRNVVGRMRLKKSLRQHRESERSDEELLIFL